MLFRIVSLALIAASGLIGAKLPDWYVRSLQDAEFQVRLVRDTGEIERLAGDALDGEVILVELRVKPLYGAKFALDRNAFLMRARNTNNTSPAQSPERIAGSGVLALGTQSSKTTPDIFSQADDGIWAGAPGTGSRPRRLGPHDVAGGGSTTAEVQSVSQQAVGDDSVEGRLHRFALPLEAEEHPVNGYLYFEIPAKVKRKHLELSYDGVLGEFLVEFKRPE